MSDTDVLPPDLGGRSKLAPDDAFPTEAIDAPAVEVLSRDEADELVATIAPRIEALLLCAHSALTPARLADVLNLPSSEPIREAIDLLNDDYRQTNRSFRIESVAGGYRILTLPEFGDLIAALTRREADAKLTAPAQEALAIIAYKQPVLRGDVEAIRGVGCGETIRSLMDKRLVKIAGRAELPGRPILYGTTKRFLEVFGLGSLKDLPRNESQEKAKTE